MRIINTGKGQALPLMVKQQMAVSHEGGNVTFHIGNSSITMEYAAALQASILLRLHGKAAKRWVGDDSRSWLVIGNLRDAEAMLLEEQKRRWA